MTPLRGFADRIKPHFKTTPRGGSPAQAAAPQQPAGSGAVPAGAPAQPAAAAAQPGVAVAAPAGQAAPAAPAAPTTQMAAAQPSAPAPAADVRPARDEQLARRFAELQWDLGGLAYEMAIRDHFRLDLLVAQAARLQAVDAELAADERARNLQRSGAAGNCPTCGALYARGAAFCSQCGTHLLGAAAPQQPTAQPQIAAAQPQPSPAQPQPSPAQPQPSPAQPQPSEVQPQPAPAQPQQASAPTPQPAPATTPQPPGEGSAPA